ncbi:MAG: MBL fold metallo-hydrolase [Bacillota bacterium]
MSRPIIEEFLTNLYRVEIPLPQNPLKATNSYMIKAGQKNLIIDTGMNRKECMEAMSAALQELGVDLRHTDFFITHLHADHSGLVSELAAPSARVYFNKPDAAVLEQKNYWQELYLTALKYGFSESDLQNAIEKHPGNKYSPSRVVDLTLVQEGDTITIGGYNLQCVETPGHTRGHTCLYEPDRKLLISGDHILGDITPNISSWDDSGDPLREYYRSLGKIYDMEVDLVLPGHRSIVTDCRRRIMELKEHHEKRLVEVRRILADNGPSSAVQVASRMTWDIIAAGWDEFPLMQKWFATGEAIAHLRYLETEAKVQREFVDETIIFMPV